MVLMRARFRVPTALRADVLRSLQRVMGVIRLLPGCLSSHVLVDVEETDRVMLIEEWSDCASLRARLKGDQVKVLLAALDSASESPAIWFDSLENSKGIEFIAECQGA